MISEKLKRNLLSRGIVWKILFLFIGIYGVYGTLIFFGAHYTHSADYSPDMQPFDMVVVFTGDEERIPPAFELIDQGKAKSLVISRASQSEITDWSKKYNGGNAVPHFLEPQATSTHENAVYCSDIIKLENVHRVILITSSYHMNRSYRLLSLALRGYSVKIACYSVFPFRIEDESVLKRIPYFQIINRIERMNTFFNYCKFMIDGIRMKDSNGFEHFLENKYNLVIKQKMGKYDYQREFPMPPEMRR